MDSVLPENRKKEPEEEVWRMFVCSQCRRLSTVAARCYGLDPKHPAGPTSPIYVVKQERSGG